MVPLNTNRVEAESDVGSIGSLKVTLMAVLTSTAMALFEGVVADTSGAVVSIAAPVVKLHT